MCSSLGDLRRTVVEKQGESEALQCWVEPWFLLWATGTALGSKPRRLLFVVGGEMKESGEPQGMKSSPAGLL